MLAVTVTILKITGRFICSANMYCDNNREVLWSVNSYCSNIDNNGEVYL